MDDEKTKEFAWHTMALFQFMQAYLRACEDEPNLSVKALYNRFCKERLKGSYEPPRHLAFICLGADCTPERNIL